MTKFFNYALFIFFFLLPWQTRWIFWQVSIEGQAFEFGKLSIYALEILILFIFLISGSKQFSKENQKPVILTAVLMLPVVISAFFAINGELALNTLMHVSFGMLLFVTLLDKRVNARLMMQGFVAGLIIPVCLGIWQSIAGASPASTLLGLAAHDASRLGEAVTGYLGDRTLRAHGGFSHPNIFGGYLAVGIATVLGLISTAKKEKEIWMLGGAGFLLSIGLLLTFSQSAWLGLVLAFVVGAMVMKMKNTDRARILVIPVAFLIIGGAFTYMYASGSAVASEDVIELEARSNSERVEMYQEFPQTMKRPETWFVGNGIGNYTLALAEQYPGKEWYAYQPIHNVFLLVFAEIGILGVIAVLLWSSTIDKINFARFPNRDAVTAFMMGNVILVILFFDHYLWSSWAGLALVAFVMAMTVRLGEKG